MQLQKNISLFVMLVCISATCHAGLELDSGSDSISLTPHVEILRDASGKLGLPEVSRSPGFRPHDHDRLSFAFTADAIWTHWELQNSSNHAQSWYLEISNPRLSRAELFVIRDNDKIEKQTVRGDINFDSRPLQYHSPVFTISLSAGESVKYYLRTYTETSHFLPLRLWQPDKWAAKTNQEYVTLGVIFGALTIFLVYSLILFFAIRGEVFLFFVLYIAITGAYLSIINGLAFQFIWPGSPWWALRSVNLIGACSPIAGLFLARSFLSTRTRLPRVDLGLRSLITILLILSVWSIFGPYRIVTPLILQIALAYPPVLMAISLYVWKKGMPEARYFAFSFAAVTLTLGLHLFRLLGMAPINPITIYAIPIGMVIEFFVMSIGLVDRVNNLRRSGEKEIKQRLEASERARKLEHSFRRFVPTPSLEILGKPDLSKIELGDQISGTMTIMFIDIRAFTARCESSTARENFAFLNSYFQTLAPCIHRNNGFICRYIGDAMLCVFPKSADDAFAAALETLQELEQFNERQADDNPPLKIGIGINSGRVQLGTVGEEHRMEVAIVGDAVNTAARVQDKTKEFPHTILLTDSTIKLLNQTEGYLLTPVGNTTLRGREKSVELYALVGKRQTAESSTQNL